MLHKLENRLTELYSEMSEAAKKHDLLGVEQFSRKAAELEHLKKDYHELEARICGVMEMGTTTSRVDANASKPLRELQVEITAGMKQQNLLTLTPHVKRGRIRVGEQLNIQAIPSGHRFQTDLVTPGNRLRARGEIAQFYRDAAVNDGDRVALTEIEPGRWTLKKVLLAGSAI